MAGYSAATLLIETQDTSSLMYISVEILREFMVTVPSFVDIPRNRHTGLSSALVTTPAQLFLLPLRRGGWGAVPRKGRVVGGGTGVGQGLFFL